MLTNYIYLRKPKDRGWLRKWRRLIPVSQNSLFLTKKKSWRSGQNRCLTTARGPLPLSKVRGRDFQRLGWGKVRDLWWKIRTRRLSKAHPCWWSGRSLPCPVGPDSSINACSCFSSPGNCKLHFIHAYCPRTPCICWLCWKPAPISTILMLLSLMPMSL